jgi:hypothetical protein
MLVLAYRTISAQNMDRKIHLMLAYISENYGLSLCVFSEKCTISRLNKFT